MMNKMGKLKLKNTDQLLFQDISKLIEESRQYVAHAVNTTLSLLYWKIGKRITTELLQNKRAEYGKQIVLTLSRQLAETYGRGWNEKTIRHCLRSAETFTEELIVSAVQRQLGWTHLKIIMYLKDDLQRQFYMEMCVLERWSTRKLQEKIDGMLYERTAISKKPGQLIKKEIKELREADKLSPDLVFRDPYFLDFLGLRNTFSEKNLEDAILRELESFILELGQGFSFVERQKRMIIDGEETPIGLILCAEGNKEQIELLQLDKAGIKVAGYLTDLPSKQLLQQKLHQAIEISKNYIENHE